MFYRVVAKSSLIPEIVQPKRRIVVFRNSLLSLVGKTMVNLQAQHSVETMGIIAQHIQFIVVWYPVPDLLPLLNLQIGRHRDLTFEHLLDLVAWNPRHRLNDIKDASTCLASEAIVVKSLLVEIEGRLLVGVKRTAGLNLFFAIFDDMSLALKLYAEFI